MSKKGKLWAILIVTAVIVIAAVLIIFRGSIFGSDEENEDSIFGKLGADVSNIEETQFVYPEEWVLQEMSEDDVNAGILLLLERSDPTASLLIRTIYGDLDPDLNINALADSVEDALIVGVEDFDLIDTDVTTIGKSDAVIISYLQGSDSTDDVDTYQNQMVIIPTQQQTFYLTFRSDEEVFDDIQGEIDTIVTNFGNYIDSQLIDTEE